MRKKLFKLTAGILFVIMAGVLIQSCCRSKDHKICSLTFEIVPYIDGTDSLSFFNQNMADGVDTSYGQFKFRLTGSTGEVNATCQIPIPFVNTAYAFQPCLPNIVDSVPRSGLVLSLDRDVFFDNTVVAAGSNLFTHSATKDVLIYTHSNYHYFDGEISVDSINFSKFQFDSNHYKLNLKATTSFGMTNTFERQVVFDR